MEIGKCYKNDRNEFIKVIDIKYHEKMTLVKMLECNPQAHGSGILIGMRINLIKDEWTEVTYDEFVAAAQSNLDKLLKISNWGAY